MKRQRLVLDSFEEDAYELIAIHSALLPYRLAFFLNTHLGLRLFRKKEDLCFKYPDAEATYPHYLFMDQTHYTHYHLIKNSCRPETKNKQQQQQLFAVDRIPSKYLIAEHSKVDYFLKIDSENVSFNPKEFLTKILDIPQVVTAYTVDHTQLKSRNNLIFE